MAGEEDWGMVMSKDGLIKLLDEINEDGDFRQAAIIVGSFILRKDLDRNILLALKTTINTVLDSMKGGR